MCRQERGTFSYGTGSWSPKSPTAGAQGKAAGEVNRMNQPLKVHARSQELGVVILIRGCPLLVGIQTTLGGKHALITGRVY